MWYWILQNYDHLHEFLYYPGIRLDDALHEWLRLDAIGKSRAALLCGQTALFNTLKSQSPNMMNCVRRVTACRMVLRLPQVLTT